MKHLRKREDGSASHWEMTKQEFQALPKDQRNSPRKTDVPLALALCPGTGATVLIQVMYTCKHGVPEKRSCVQCEDERGFDGAIERCREEARTALANYSKEVAP